MDEELENIVENEIRKSNLEDIPISQNELEDLIGEIIEWEEEEVHKEFRKSRKEKLSNLFNTYLGEG